MKAFLAAALVASMNLEAAAQPVTYQIDPTHTLPRYEYSHMGLSIQSGRFDKVVGKITIDRATRIGSAELSIDVRSIDSGAPLLDKNIQSDALLDAARFPSITFKSSHFTFRGDDVVSVTGDLTIKGVTKPVDLTVQGFVCKPHPRLNVEACGAVATATIKRADFGITSFIPLVSDELHLSIPLEAVKADSP